MPLAARPLCHHMLLTRHPACIVLKCRHAIHAGDGRSPDSRVNASPNLPGRLVQWFIIGVALRSQLRGQSRIWCLLATPHRVPF